MIQMGLRHPESYLEEANSTLSPQTRLFSLAVAGKTEEAVRCALPLLDGLLHCFVDELTRITLYVFCCVWCFLDASGILLRPSWNLDEARIILRPLSCLQLDELSDSVYESRQVLCLLCNLLFQLF